MPPTDKRNRRAYINFIVFIFPLLVTLTCLVLYKLSQPTYNMFAASVFAYAIKIIYTFFTFICSFLCLFISIKLYKKKLFALFIIYFLFFISLLFLFLELIHYGQKIYSPQTSPTPLALHELWQIRFFFDAAFFGLGFYASFYWIRFVKTPQALKSTTSRLFVPDWSLIFYFFPIVIFFLIVNYLEYVAYSAIDTDLTAVTESHSWLFRLNQFFPHYSRPLLSTGLFIFFLKNSIWIHQAPALQYEDPKRNLKKLLIYTIVFLFFIMSGFVIANKYFPQRADLGWGKYFELNNDFYGAVHHYNECIKKNDNAHVHKELFLMYHRMGEDEAAIRHLSEAIKKSMASGNNKMTTELYKTALYFYPNTVIDPETRAIYFQK